MPSMSIRNFVYDPASQLLSVWFRSSGKRYDYQGVPPAVAEDFRVAFSKGRYFNAHIRNRYSYRHVEDNDRRGAA